MDVNCLAGSRLKTGNQSCLVGKLSGLKLAVHEVAVHRDIENAAGALLQGSLEVVGLPELARQTDGAWLVASTPAIMDQNVHGLPLRVG